MSTAVKPSLRAVCENDQPFLYQLYASTRESELSLTGWTDAQKHAFLQMQFKVQTSYYNEHFVAASFNLVILDDEAIGRLYVYRQRDEIKIIDIALLPNYCRRGIGGGLLRNLIAEATQKSLPLRIHVEQNNPALNLYQRLGFKQAGTNGLYYLMEVR
ncbi:MAG: GNAT family N-acetyltransferase [Methylococcales bacterium]